MKMATMSKKVPKAKLPRKRKKAAIKAQGRKWYHDTIKFFYICQKNPLLAESVCRFWVNDSLRDQFSMVNGVPLIGKTATRYW